MRYLIGSLLLLTACSNVDQAKIQANEADAILQLRAINSAQVEAYATKARYATTLNDLGPSGSRLIPAEVVNGTKSGYHFELTGDGSIYQVTAIPNAPGTSGNRAFFSDQSLVLRVTSGDIPGPDSPELK